ncbi:MAG TPA: lipopolysaccharide biosynthesis protein [Caulobacteraceae bacterium]|jgi:O-antigen/teichoic acid export membrane protein|nr:lipopolysaccharide biosynthesis protein [Caulobacteraceae bacterium]
MFWRGVWAYLPANIVQGVVGLLTIVVFTRLLTPQEFGLYALGFSVMTLVHTIGFTWLEASMARFFAAEQQSGRLADHFRTIYRSFAVMAWIAALVCATGLWLWPASTPLKMAIGAGLGAILGRCLIKLVQERRRAAGEVVSASALDMAQTAGGFALGALFAVLGLGGAAPLVGAGLAAVMCLPFALPKEMKFLAGGDFDAERAKRYAAYGLPISASLVLALALATTDRFLIAAYLDESNVGAYHAAYSLANRTLDVIFLWLGAAGGPALVMALERGGRKSLEESAREQASTLLLIALPAAAGLALVARPLAQVLVGEGLREAAAQVTPWIAVGGFFSGITTYYFHQAFTLARRTKLLLLAMAVPAIVNVALNLILVPRFGVIGAAWATAISYVVGALASWTLGKRAGALPIPWDTVGKCGLATALMALSVICVPSLGGILETAAKATVGLMVYATAAWLLDAASVRTHGSRLLKTFRARRMA